MGLMMWFVPLLFLVIVVAVLLRAPWWPRDRREPGSDTAREILERRFASGEITKEQFEDMKRTLGR
jgi:uncharacterized membrane protein